MAKRKTVAKKSAKKKRNVVRGVAMRKPKSKSKSRPKPKQSQKPKSRPKSKQRPELKPLKLTVDLVPHTQWYKNLRLQVPRSVWDKLRKEVYAQAGFKCQICGTEDKLNCHEIWEYEEKNRVQHLKGFHAANPNTAISRTIEAGVNEEVQRLRCTS